METHARMDLTTFNRNEGKFPHARVADYMYQLVHVRSGPMTLELAFFPWDKVPQGAIFKGQLYLMGDVVYGRFTEMRIPGEKPMPVCMMATEISSVGIIVRGGPRERPLVSPTTYLMIVEEFDEAKIQARFDAEES